ncbi:MAG TPA: SIS domain-containing protein [Streptosporangiaceae bacterium]|nr:SIS domain-containing protein [Streptosporangiaceae bacterium]
MAALTEWRLDDPEQIEAADPGNMLRQVASSAAQVRSALQATQETDLSAVLSAGRPRAIVVSGMGGSGIAGDVLSAVCGPGSPVQILPVHGYRLPGWVSASDLVIAVSCSGSTEETLSAAGDAVRRGCRLIGVGGTGSPLAGLAEQAHAPFVPVRSAGMPRSTLWGLSIPLIGVAARLGLCEAGPEAHEAAAQVLEGMSQRCRPDSDSFVNPAKGLALELAGTLPMIWGSTPLAGVAAYRFACQLNENAKYAAIAGVLPEANHNQVVAFDGPFAPDPGQVENGDRRGVPLRLVMLSDAGEHPQVTKRREASVRLAAERGIGVTELAADGKHPLQRLASLVQLIDYATVYLGIALGYDPSPITAIQELKASIA